MPYNKPKKSRIKKSEPRYYSHQLSNEANENNNSIPPTESLSPISPIKIQDNQSPYNSLLNLNRKTYTTVSQTQSPQMSFNNPSERYRRNGFASHPSSQTQTNFLAPNRSRNVIAQPPSLERSNISSALTDKAEMVNGPKRLALKRTTQSFPKDPKTGRVSSGLLLSCWCGDTFVDTVSAFNHCRDNHNYGAYLLLHRTLAQLLSTNHTEDEDEVVFDKNTPKNSSPNSFNEKYSMEKNYSGSMIKRKVTSDEDVWLYNPMEPQNFISLSDSLPDFKEKISHLRKYGWLWGKGPFGERFPNRALQKFPAEMSSLYSCPGCHIPGNWHFIRSHLRTSGHLIGGAKCICGYLCIEKDCVVEHFSKSDKSGSHSVYKGTLYSASEFLVDKPFQKQIDLSDDRFHITLVGEDKYLIGFK